MFVLKQRFGNVSSGENSEEDESEGDILQVKCLLHWLKIENTNNKFNRK